METNQINFLEEMSNFIFTTKYARFNEVNKRRETLSETVDRVSEMHLRKYSFLPEEDINRIKWAFEMVKEKKVVPSMRSMQFGGKAVEAHNSRIYNCGVRHIDSLRAFAEFFYCLLSGTGMTAGVSEKVISNLPNLVNKEDKTGSVITYVIDDTIEGWADSVETLLMCYHKNTPFSGRKIVFDYSKIRPKGTPLKTGGGKAPGHEGLQQAHRKIKNLLDYCIEELNSYLLRSIDIYDILMHCADAVLSGGIRRAATAVIFDHDDNLMLNAKINQKVSSFKRFEKIDNLWEGTVTVKKKKYEVKLTDYEYETLLKENKEISWIHTEPQRARSNNSVLLIRDKTTKVQFEKIVERTKQYGEPGFVFADDELALFNPCITKDTLINTNRGNLNVIQIIDSLNKEEDLFALSFNTINRTLEYQQILHAEKTKEDSEIFQIETIDGNKLKLSKGHLVYTQRGYIKVEELNLEDSLFSFNESNDNDFSGLNIDNHINNNNENSNLKINKIVYGENELGIIIKKIIKNEKRGYSSLLTTKQLKIRNITKIENEDVYDIAVNNNRNFFANKILVHNCFEISFIPKTKDGRFGVQFCNLSEINGAKINSLEDWKLAIEAATILGTIQAGYTEFPYLSKAAKELTEEEALLGVSLTGWFDNPDLLLNDKNQYIMAKLAIKINEEWSKKIGINPASRVTCVKPSGTASAFLGTANGIHPNHSKRFFRRVQMNKLDNIYRFFKEVNSHATEESVWSNTKSDDVITFPITINDNAITKEDLSAIEHLSYIKRTQENWVVAGTSPINKKNITHNISSTVLVKENEWEEVINYLFENRHYFTAVSLLPNYDTIYKQAPFQKIQDSDEEKWNDLVYNWKSIDWSQFNETEDNTKLAEQLACAGGACSI
jgi:hypothetical protein